MRYRKPRVGLNLFALVYMRLTKEIPGRCEYPSVVFDEDMAVVNKDFCGGYKP